MNKKIPRFKLSFPTKDLIVILMNFWKKDVIEGEDIAEFERQFAQYIGTKFAISIPSARIGLYSILKNLDLNKGDEIILPAFTFYIIPEVVKSLELKPVFVDINPLNCTIDASLIKRNITPKTKAIIPTHLFGQPCEMDEILEIAKENKITIIEDCAKACGSEYKGKKVGSFGDFAYFTFGMTKDINTLGGGMLATNNEIMAEKIKKELSTYRFPGRGMLAKKIFLAYAMNVAASEIFFNFFIYPLLRLFDRFGIEPISQLLEEKEMPFEPDTMKSYNFRMANLQAKMGLRNLEQLNILNQKRLTNAQFLNEQLKDINCIQIPFSCNGRKHTYVTYVIQTDSRERLAKELLRRGIDTSKGYMKNFANDDYPNARDISKKILHLPIYASLKEKDLQRIVSIIRKFNETQKHN